MTSDRLLTIVIPTIGRITLQRAIDSALAQTVRCELLVEHDPGLSGCGATLNRALGKIATPWYMGCADDDRLAPTAAAAVAEHAPHADMIVFRMQYPEGHFLPTVTEVNELAAGNVGSSFAIRTDLARSIRYVECPPAEMPEDWAMIDAVRQSGARIVIVPEIQMLLAH